MGLVTLAGITWPTGQSSALLGSTMQQLGGGIMTRCTRLGHGSLSRFRAHKLDSRCHWHTRRRAGTSAGSSSSCASELGPQASGPAPALSGRCASGGLTRIKNPGPGPRCQCQWSPGPADEALRRARWAPGSAKITMGRGCQCVPVRASKRGRRGQGQLGSESRTSDTVLGAGAAPSGRKAA